jgi:hypothetical protein
LTVGCGTHALSFTSSGDIEDTLPSGGKPGALHETVTNPGKYKNTLVGQVVALTLSVGFDAHDPDFGTANSSLAGLRLTDGDYVDWTIAAVLERANDVLGGCLPGEEASDLNHALSVINENFVDGTTLGTSLSCP